MLASRPLHTDAKQMAAGAIRSQVIGVIEQFNVDPRLGTDLCRIGPQRSEDLRNMPEGTDMQGRIAGSASRLASSPARKGRLG